MIYEIHEISPELFEYTFSDTDIVVFDDALYSQYMYKDKIKGMHCGKYIAVTPILLHICNTQQIYTNRNIAMWKFKEFRDTSAYMSFIQLKEMLEYDENMKLCMHRVLSYKIWNTYSEI